MRARGATAALLGLALPLWLLVGCSKPPGVAAELAALQAAGHGAAGFADSDARPFSAKACRAGTLDRVAAVLCEYGSAEALSLGQQGAEAWIGEATTGVVLRRDLYLLALADRDRADPSGRAVSKLAKTFRRK